MIFSQQFHVFELTRQLPRFSMYLLCGPEEVGDVKSSCVFQVNERVQRVSHQSLYNTELTRKAPVTTGADNSL